MVTGFCTVRRLKFMNPPSNPMNLYNHYLHVRKRLGSEKVENFSTRR